MQSIAQITTSIHSTLASVVDTIPGIYVPRDDLEEDITSFAMRTVGTAALSLLVLTVIAALFSEKVPKLKMPLFVMMAIAMIGSSLALISSTVYLNVKADSGGPVHWHADIEYWVCGNELELRDPTGTLSNKIGTATLHEHDDRRIHLEGVVVEEEYDASLGKFQHVIGGAITEDALVIPLDDDVSRTFENDLDGDGPSDSAPQLVEPYIMNDGDNGRVAYMTSGQTCGDEEAEVQTFVYRYGEDGDKTYKQYKLDDAETLAYFGIDHVNEFSIYDDSNVPPGDCVIFEFDRAKSKTDKICEQYGVRDISLCEKFGVEPSKRAICENTQIDYDANENYYLETETEEQDVLGSFIFNDDADNTPSEAEALGVSIGRAIQDPETPEAEVLGATSEDAQTLESANVFNLGVSAGSSAAGAALEGSEELNQ